MDIQRVTYPILNTSASRGQLSHPTTTSPLSTVEFYLLKLALHLLNSELLKQLLLYMNSSLNQREDCPHLLTNSIKPGMGLVQCHHLAWSSLLPSGYSDTLDHFKRQPKFCPSETEAEATKDSSVCLAQKEKMQILQKEVELKITLTDVKRCWGRNSMWYQVKKPCFSQVQIRTTHRLLDCSKGIDQCGALDFEQHFFLLWTAGASD